jgi:hypothetical protein
MNTYAYVGGNPPMKSDPTGLEAWQGRVTIFAGQVG